MGLTNCTVEEGSFRALISDESIILWHGSQQTDLFSLQSMGMLHIQENPYRNLGRISSTK